MSKGVKHLEVSFTSFEWISSAYRCVLYFLLDLSIFFQIALGFLSFNQITSNETNVCRFVQTVTHRLKFHRIVTHNHLLHTLYKSNAKSLVWRTNWASTVWAIFGEYWNSGSEVTLNTNNGRNSKATITSWITLQGGTVTNQQQN